MSRGTGDSHAGLSDSDKDRLLAIGRRLVTERDLDRLLGEVLDVALELTGARYAALGVLDADRVELEKFLYVGIDDETRREIGSLPRGKGILGELIRDPKPLRLAEIGSHPRSYGMPPGHPPMTTFLGVPILIGAEAFGNLYLTDKAEGAEFDAVDEDVVTVLADWAGVAIDNARLYSRLDERRTELERAVEGLRANVELATAVGRETDETRILELIAKRGRALLGARTFVVLLLSDDRLVVAQAAGEGAERIIGETIDAERSIAGQALRSGNVERLDDFRARIGVGLGDLAGDASRAIVAPLFAGRPRGALIAFDRVDGGESFDPGHELMLSSFAASAATAIARAHAVEAEKLHLSIDATERERARWARELHDDTLQDLGALKMLLDAVPQSELPSRARETLDKAIAHVEQGIDNLHGLIVELRPAALDQIGLGAALDALIGRVGANTGLEIEARLDLAYHSGRAQERLEPDLEEVVYRLVQEALNNTIKHAGATRAEVEVSDRYERVEIRITDDGSGFDPQARSKGFGLIGMRERVHLLGGRLSIESAPQRGTTIRATLPVTRKRALPSSRARSALAPGLTARSGRSPSRRR